MIKYFWKFKNVEWEIALSPGLDTISVIITEVQHDDSFKISI